MTSDGCVPVDGEFPDCTTGHLTGGYVFAKTSDPQTTTTVAPGQQVTYTVEVAHVGRAAITGATVVDDLTDVLDDANYNNDATATVGEIEVVDGALIWSGDLDVDEVITITYSVTVHSDGDGTLRNVVTSPDDRGVCVDAADGNPDCTTTHGKVKVPPLPSTGASLAGPLGLGGLLLLLGAGAMGLRRRLTS